MPNVLHDVFKLKISTGARRTFLSDADLEVQKHFGINDYTDTHDDNADAPEDPSAVSLSRDSDRNGTGSIDNSAWTES
jgi:hypothetical protein